LPKIVDREPDPSPLAALEPRRRCILEAAYEVLMERGYAGASTLEIATRARVSKRELYTEFGNKSGILKALIAATAARMQLPLATAEIHDRDDLAEALVAYGTMALAELTSPHVIAINRLAAAEAGRSSELGAILEENGREPNRKALIDLLAKAQAAGVLAPGEPGAMAGQFFSLLLGDLMLRLMLGVTPRPGSAEIKKRAQSASQAVLALHATAASSGRSRRRP
jgi:AcrR family transcriptional regulator